MKKLLTFLSFFFLTSLSLAQSAGGGTGIYGISYPLLAPNGLVSAPSYSYLGEPSSGFYRVAAGDIRFSLSGIDSIRFTNSTLTLAAGTILSWGGAGVTSANLFLIQEGANSLSQRNGLNAQTYSIYNSFTDVSNYERGTASWQSNAFVLGTEKAGTGLIRDTALVSNRTVTIGTNVGTPQWFFDTGNTGHFKATNDNLNDIGAAGATRPRTVYVGTSVVTPTVSAATVAFTGFTFANIATNLTANGMIGYCSDCTIAATCAGAGTGALAKRLNGANVCN